MEYTDRDLLIEELHDLQRMEKQILEVLSRMLKATPSRELRTRFQENIHVLKGHMRLLDRAVEIAPKAPLDVASQMVKRVLTEGQSHVDEQISLLTKMIVQNEFTDSVALFS